VIPLGREQFIGLLIEICQKVTLEVPRCPRETSIKADDLNSVIAQTMEFNFVLSAQDKWSVFLRKAEHTGPANRGKAFRFTAPRFRWGTIMEGAMSIRPTRLRYSQAILGILSVLTACSVGAEEPFSYLDVGLAPAEYDNCVSAGPFKIIPDQKYALCFPGRCWSFNDVLYCSCEKLPEDAVAVGEQADDWDDSISLPLNISDNIEFPDDSNVCDVMANGNDEGYRVSTFSLSPAKGIYEGDDGAVYTCPKNSPGSYAQCDGGLCFEDVSQMTGTENLFDKQIICSCPVVEPSPTRLAYNAYGPFDPDASFPPNRCTPEDCEAVCGAASTPQGKHNKNSGMSIPNGSGPNIPIGAPLGSGRLFACLLAEFQQQQVEPIQECDCKYSPGKRRDQPGAWTAVPRIVDDPCLGLNGF
jgi:hypothetical protein